MKKLGRIIVYSLSGLLIFSLASSFPNGDSIYCHANGQFYAELGFDCQNHVNAFLSAYLANPQTYFFTISLLLVVILLFHHIPYLKPEYWVRIADHPGRWVVKKIFLTSLEVAFLFYFIFLLPGFALGFSIWWNLQLLYYLLYLFIFIALVNMIFHVIYVISEKYIIALFAFFFINIIFFYIIYEISWLIGGTFTDVDGIAIFNPANDPLILRTSIAYIFIMSIVSIITLFIALGRKECFK